MKRFRLFAVLLLVVGLASCRVSVSPSEPGPDLNTPELVDFTINGADGSDDNTVVLPSVVGQTRATLSATVRDRRSDVTSVVIEIFFIPSPSEATLVASFDAVRESGDSYRADWDFSDADNGFYRFLIRAGDTAGNVGESRPPVRVLLFRDAPTD